MDKNAILDHLAQVDYELNYFKTTYDEARIVVAQLHLAAILKELRGK